MCSFSCLYWDVSSIDFSSNWYFLLENYQVYVLWSFAGAIIAPSQVCQRINSVTLIETRLTTYGFGQLLHHLSTALCLNFSSWSSFKSFLNFSYTSWLFIGLGILVSVLVLQSSHLPLWPYVNRVQDFWFVWNLLTGIGLNTLII